MLKLVLALFCCSWLVTNSVSAGLAPFIEKCVWNDKACLLRSSQKALPTLAAGISNFGISPLDPLPIKDSTVKQNGVSIAFKNIVVKGLKDCQVIDVERNIKQQWLKFTAECPIDAKGSYQASGKLLGIPIEGNGPCWIKTDKLRVSIKNGLSYFTGKDGQKYWKVADNGEHTSEFVTKTKLEFKNLFNGDKDKASPIETLLDSAWKELVESFGKPVIDEVVDQIVDHLRAFADQVPASELEL